MTPLELPTTDWTDWLGRRGRESLADAAAHIAALKAAEGADVLERWNDAGIALSNAFAVASLMSSVHPDADVIELAEQLEVEAQRFSTDVMLDRDVHDRLAAIDAAALGADAQRVLREALRSFRRSGVDRDEETRDRLRALNEKLTDLGQQFSRNIRDGRREVQVPLSALEGLPADFVESHQPDGNGMVTLTTEYPDVIPFMAYSRDAEARRALAWEYNNRAWPDNDQVLADLLRTRDEKARLLGYDGWADYDAEVKMIGKGAEIIAFIDRIADAAAERARADVAQLLERGRAEGIERVDLSNSRYLLETVRREQHDLDPEEIRSYFDFAKVQDGLLAVTGRLFGVTWERVDVPVWHPDVTAYDVYYANDESSRIGRIYLDLHPRERKYSHAAQFTLVDGVAARQLPEGVLVCNFSRGLMEHDDVVTLFHEFGHLMHHVLAGGHKWVEFSGVATEWDFVEAPSQMLEEWAWDPSVLQTFATNAAGEPIPADLVTRMRAADDLGKGLQARTQMFYAALSYRFHQDLPEDLTAAMLDLYDQYSLVAPLEDTHFFTSFGHLEGYSSGYYTYMWSLVIAKDMFSAFDRDDLFAPEVVQRYRDRVLVPGGSKDAADLVEDFLGRPYNTEAYSRWLAS